MSYIKLLAVGNTWNQTGAQPSRTCSVGNSTARLRSAEIPNPSISVSNRKHTHSHMFIMQISVTKAAVTAFLLIVISFTSNAVVIPPQDDRFTGHSIYRTVHLARRVSFATPLSRMYRARPSNPPRIVTEPEQEEESQDKWWGPTPAVLPHEQPCPGPMSVEPSPSPAFDELFALDASPSPTSLPCSTFADSITPSPIPMLDEIFDASTRPSPAPLVDEIFVRQQLHI